MKFQCCGCDAKTEWDNPDQGCYNVGAAQDGTGWKTVFLRDGGSLWCCPSCFDKVQRLAIKLVKILGPDFNFPGLLPKKVLDKPER